MRSKFGLELIKPCLGVITPESACFDCTNCIGLCLRIIEIARTSALENNVDCEVYEVLYVYKVLCVGTSDALDIVIVGTNVRRALCN